MNAIFNYCPKCKSEKIETINGHKYSCKDCGFEYFHNVASSVAVILYNKDEILFTVRNENPGLGLLDLPGGFVDYSENATTTVQRELKEELNIDLLVNDIIFLGSYPNQYLYKDILYHTLDLCFKIEIDKNKILDFNKNEIQTLKWINKKEITLDLFAFTSTKNMILDYIKH
ncbi:MAG: NUDIX domain-containing protein [Solirubrobacteraceae bacterium]